MTPQPELIIIRESHLPALAMGIVVGAFGVVFWWAVGSVVVRFFGGLW